MSHFKIPYSALTRIPSEVKSDYNNWLLIKGYASGVVQKDGFIMKRDVQKVADLSSQSKSNLIKKLRSLVSAGLIDKNKYGYTLTSKHKINRKLNLINFKNGTERTPFFKYELTPSINNNRQLELIKLYYLIIQIFIQYQFRANAIKTDKRKTLPESFELSMEKIMKRGNYKSTMTVMRLIDDLERVKLTTIAKGAKGNLRIAQKDCNQYTLHPLSKVNWNRLDNEPKDWKLFLRNLDGKSTRKPKRKIADQKVKKVTHYNSSEVKFQKVLKAGLQDILVEAGVLSNRYKSFGSSAGRKLEKAKYSECLSYALNDSELRKILFKVISPKEILVENSDSYFYDARLSTYSKDRYNFFNYHQLGLVESNGNFNEYEDEFLFSKNNRKEEIKDRLYGKVSV